MIPDDIRNIEIEKQYQTIDFDWLNLHYKTTVSIVLFTLVVECLMSVVFDLDGETLKRIGRELQCFHVGPSWGGYESMYICPGADPAQVAVGCKKGLARMHIGQEDTALLKEDWETVLKKVL